MSDVNAYSHSSSIFLDYFCGFIDGRNALQSRTIWNIHMKPNINIHFLKFILFDNYWYCDYEYLRVKSNDKSTTFCGNRLPWMHDASDTRVTIILMTLPTGTKNYQLELLYYGVYVPNYECFILFTQPFSATNLHYLNAEQNALESIHFISSGRLDTLEVNVVGLCTRGRPRMDEAVCYDGPGIKSPILPFASKRTRCGCRSSTFQMMCIVSRVHKCSQISFFWYQALRFDIKYIKNVVSMSKIGNSDSTMRSLEIDKSDSRGTTKYIYYHPPTISSAYYALHIIGMNISFPYMFSEGNSCMYGGVYIIRSVSVNHSEIASFCTPNSNKESDISDFRSTRYVTDLINISIVIIHYAEYSTARIMFYAEYKVFGFIEHLKLNPKYLSEETVSITMPKVAAPDYDFYVWSYILKLRKIQYINITLNDKDLLFVTLAAYFRTSCINITVLYSPHPSNIRGRKYDQETRYWHISFEIYDFIHAIFINMTACNLHDVPVWGLLVNKTHFSSSARYNINTTQNFLLSARERLIFQHINRGVVPPFWVMVHMRKPEDIPDYATWRVFIQACYKVSHTYIEASIDDYGSSSVYAWNYFKSPGDFYITVSKAVNIVFESSVSVTHEKCAKALTVLFVRHFIYDDRVTKYVSGQTPEQSHFTFHNKR